MINIYFIKPHSCHCRAQSIKCNDLWINNCHFSSK
jgi:hypothetical protein